MRFRPLLLALLVCACSLAAATSASAAPTWSPEFQVSNGTGDVFEQHVVTDAAGRTTILFNEDGVLRARTRAAGGQFGAPVDIAPGDDVETFDAASDAAGNITVGYITASAEVKVKRAPVGTTSWPAGQTYTTAVDPFLISAAANPGGTAIVAWNDDSDGSIYGVRKDPADSSFSATEDLAQTPSNGIDELDTAVRSDGTAFILHTRDGSVFAIWSGTSDWDEFSDNQLSGSGEAADGTIVANGTGDLVAYWDEDDGSHSGVRSSLFSGASFAASNEVSDSAGPDAFVPSASLDDAGNVTLAYFTFNGFGYGVTARSGEVNTPQYGPFRELTAAGGTPPVISTTRANDGTGLVALSSPDVDNAFSFTARVSRQSGDAFGPLQTIGSQKNLFCGCVGLLVAADGHGGATGSWATDDGLSYLDASILAEGGSSSSPADVLPQIISAKLGVTTLRATSSGATISKHKAPKGTTLTVNASEAGTLAIEVQQRTSGRKASRSSKCSAKAKKGRRCTIWKSLTSTTKAAKSGVNKYKFSGRVGGEKLKPGQYRLVLTLKGGSGRTSAPKTRTFKIVK